MSRQLELNLERRTVKITDLTEKLKHKKNCRTTIKRTRSKIENAIKMAKELVRSGKLKPLSEYKTVMAGDEEFLRQYVQKCFQNGEYVLDFETTGLNPLRDIIVGVCLYTPNELPLYIPINHTTVDNIRIEGQMDEAVCRDILKSLIESETKYINHNVKFDGSMAVTNWGVHFGNFYWDTLIAGKLLNENEKNHRLKYLHAKYVKKDVKDWAGFDDLFEDIPANYVPIDVMSVYGANDGLIAYQLYQFQRKYLDLNHQRKDMRMLAQVMFEIEMPLTPLLIDMELRGVQIDDARAKELDEKYSKLLAETEAKLDAFVEKHKKQILANAEMLRLTNGTGKLNYNSPPQVSFFCYKILKLPVVDSKSPNGTGKDIIKKWLDSNKVKAEHKEWLQTYKEYKTIGKLLTTYIHKIPKAKEPSTNAVHTQFNQYGAVTGRFSSSHPEYKINLQNIPSRNKEIRTIFVAREGHVLISSDFSQIEPRTLASLSGDDEMIQAYKEGKDLYATMGARVYNVGYWDCMEKYEDGTPNPEGKVRRDSMKSVLLGIMYERGAKAIAEQFNKPVRWAEQLIEDFKRAYPKIELYRLKVVHQAETKGYVNTLFGRKRRLPNMQLSNKDDWLYKEAHRQCLNAVIQGTAGDIMKKSMVELWRNEEFRRLGGRILITVHDELICEAPKENAIRCGEILSNTMKRVGEEALGLPMKCDIEITERWYGADISDELVDEEEDDIA